MALCRFSSSSRLLPVKWRTFRLNISVIPHRGTNSDAILPSVESPDLKATDSSVPRSEDGSDIVVRRVPIVPEWNNGPRCPGCGSLFQTSDKSRPGYATHSIVSRDSEFKIHTICQRCHKLKYSNSETVARAWKNNAVAEVSFFRYRPALILLVLDATNLNDSLYPTILDTVGREKQVIVVVNKADLLPRDQRNPYYMLERLTSTIRGMITSHPKMSDMKVMDLVLVSAKFGCGLDSLASALKRHWVPSKDVVLLGVTNVGKSSIYNFLTQLMDYGTLQGLSTPALDHFIPSSTLGLQRSPFSERRLERIRKRLMDENQPKVSQSSPVITIDREIEEDLYPEEAKEMRSSSKTTDASSEELAVTKSSDSLTNWSIQLKPVSKSEGHHGAYLFDTPGFRNPEQLSQFLTPEEMNALQTKLWYVPKVLLLKPGESMLLGGLARIDYLEVESIDKNDPTIRNTVNESAEPVFFIVYTTTTFPVFITKTEKADIKWRERLGEKLLQVPFGTPERLSMFPPYASKEFVTYGTGDKACGDIAFSTVGWVSVNASQRQVVRLRCHSPNGIGIYFNDVSLLPYMLEKRGKRGVMVTGSLDRRFYTIPRKTLSPLFTGVKSCKKVALQWKQAIEKDLDEKKDAVRATLKAQQHARGVLTRDQRIEQKLLRQRQKLAMVEPTPKEDTSQSTVGATGIATVDSSACDDSNSRTGTTVEESESTMMPHSDPST